MKYVCEICGWVYDEEIGVPEKGIAPGTKFEDLPDDFECEFCGVDKSNFAKEE
jgi:rubredoxin-NAD+ reductase